MAADDGDVIVDTTDHRCCCIADACTVTVTVTTRRTDDGTIATQIGFIFRHSKVDGLLMFQGGNETASAAVVSIVIK